MNHADVWHVSLDDYATVIFIGGVGLTGMGWCGKK